MFARTHSLRNLSVALAFQGGLRRFLYASAGHFADCHLGPGSDIAYSDFVIVPGLATESLDLHSAGGQYTRVQKLLRVAEIEDSLDTLDVCLDSRAAGNCSACRKCARTLLILEIAGIPDRYDAVFDRAIYRGRRAWAIEKIIESNEPIPREIVRFAREREFALVP